MRLALADIANPGWTAGSNYYFNLLTALRRLGDDRRPHVHVVVWPHTPTSRHELYRELADDHLEVPRLPRPRFVERQLRRARRRFHVDAKTDLAVETLLKEHAIDVMFACWMEFGSSFDIPLLGWIPDFQHRHYPALFSAAENRQRDELFERMAANCTRVILSSEHARHDFERFFPAFADKARVLRFVSQVPATVFDGEPSRVCAEYHLPNRFVYLPNQFWVHKNHGLVLDALALLATKRPEITVVCSGNPADNRDPLYFGELLARVSRLGLRDRFVALGWVPQVDTFRLLRQSIAVLQPSLFEGWSTTVEETKTIGKTVILSDIPVHREQAPPGALYFDPADPGALAARLVEVYDTRSPGADEEFEVRAREALPARTREYAETFVEIAQEVIASRS